MDFTKVSTAGGRFVFFFFQLHKQVVGLYLASPTRNPNASEEKPCMLSFFNPIITGVHTNQDQIWLVKIGKYMGFYVDRRS